MEPVVLISAYLFLSYSFGWKLITHTYIIQGETAIMEWLKKGLYLTMNSKLLPQLSQLMECENMVDDSQDIGNDEDNYVGL